MNWYKKINKPEYIFQPRQILRKIKFELKKTVSDKILVTLPWETKLLINPNQDIGRSILTMGIYDIALTESVFRLAKPGDFTLDIGANIGFITNLLSVCIGKAGKVFSFEPHPEILSDYLKPNIGLLNKIGLNNITLYPIALSNEVKTGKLYIPVGFQNNNGIASLEKIDSVEEISIQLDKLDNLINPDEEIKLMKIDVEGHELSVFEGAKTILENKKIRNIIYEDHVGAGSEVTNYLTKIGYTIFRINKTISGVLLTDPKNDKYKGYEAPNYLATLFPEEIKTIFKHRSWSFLQFNSLKLI